MKKPKVHKKKSEFNETRNEFNEMINDPIFYFICIGMTILFIILVVVFGMGK